tara:strand:+ start:3705 stop:4238 length:534 start_codon:yes stop_codon:yes gene_type:complete
MDLSEERTKSILCRNSSTNGRLDIRAPLTQNVLELYDRVNTKSTKNNYNEAMTGNWSQNVLSKTFFSMENIRIIQNGIRAGVFNNSKGKYKIGDQNEDTLKIIMRSIFLTHAVNIPNDITKQIVELNDLVCGYCVPQLMGECEGYIKYKNDVSTLVVPIDRPLSTYHNNVLETKRFF